MTMFIHFFCLCPLSLTIKLNFNISKVAYCKSMNSNGVCLGYKLICINGFQLMTIVRDSRAIPYKKAKTSAPADKDRIQESLTYTHRLATV